MENMPFVLRFRAQGLGAFPTIAAALILTVACAKPADTTPAAETPARTGVDLVTFPVKYTDIAPSISDDGTRVVFVSGRDSTDTASSLKIYKSDWPSGNTPLAPVRLTDTDLGVEQDVALAPAGDFTAITTLKDGIVDLYLQAYSGGAPVQVTNDALIDSRPRFSPDSKLLAWIVRDNDAGTAKLVGVTIGAGAAADVATVTTLSTDSENVIDFTWVAPAGSGYSVTLATRDAGAGTTALTKVSFATPAAAAAAARTVIASSVVLNDAVRLSSKGGKIAGVSGILPVGAKMSTSLGVGDAPRETPVTAEPFFFDAAAAANTAPTTFAKPAMYQILGIGGLLADGSAALVAGRSAYRCVATATTFNFGAAISLTPTDGTTAPTFFVPRTAVTAGAFDVATDFCDLKRSDGSVGRVDDHIVAAVLNGAATATAFRAVYVTRFAPHFDVNCNLKVGDPEIYGMSIQGATKTIATVSVNPAPIVDGDRGTQQPCQL